jgi:hypothetical protein
MNEESQFPFSIISQLGRSENCETAANPTFFELLRASQASDVSSIPIARSITHDDSIVLTPLNPLISAIKPGFGPRWSQLNKLLPSIKLRPGGIGRETPVIQTPEAQNSHLCEVWINKRVPTLELPPVVGGGGNSREGNTAQIREGQYSLEAIRCQQRSTLGKGNAHEENRGCSGSIGLVAIVVSRRSRREIS